MEKKTTKAKKANFVLDLMEEEECLSGKYSRRSRFSVDDQLEARIATDEFIREVLNSPLGYIRTASY